jgi:hypothetical protein
MNGQEKILPQFLRDLANEIENEQLNSSQVQSIGEFYVSYLFNEDTDNQDQDVSKQDEDISDKDFKKFLALGWYVYNKIVTDEEIVEK